MQVRASAGWQTVTVSGINPPRSRKPQALFVDALTGVASTRDQVELTWNDDMLKVRFRVPDKVNGPGNNPPVHLAYVVVRPGA
jgi:hypothetical protein